MPFSGYKIIKEETLQDIADAIREKTGTTALLDPADFAAAIRGLNTSTDAVTGYYDIKVGDTFSINYDGSSPTVECPFCLAYQDDGGVLVFTAVAVGDGTIYIRISDTLIGQYGVRVSAAESGGDDAGGDDSGETGGGETEHTHVYTAVVTPATCENGGYTTHICKCGHSYIDSETDPNGHNFAGGWVTVTAPTCTALGKERRTCNTLGCKGSEERPIAALGHDWSENLVEHGNGYAYECKRCGAFSIVTDCDHASEEVVDLVLPTCTSEGYTVYRCSMCDHEETRDIVPKLGHSYKDVVTKPTCLANGYTTHTCTRCGDTYTDSTVPASGHTWSGWTTTLEPTCDEDGSKYHTCTECGKTGTSTIEALGHKNTTYHEGKAATCTEDGYTGYNECLDCGKIIDGKRVIKALGHDLSTIPEVPATCTEYGRTALTVCSRCDYSTGGEVLEPNGHFWGVGGGWVTETAATCTESGTEKHTCNTCGQVERRTVAALGHDWRYYEDTNVSSGLSRECTRCHEIEEDVTR